MTSMCAVILTAVLHLLMRISVFYEQPKNQCSTAPEIASVLFVVSVFLFLLDNDFFPVRYRCIPSVFRVLCEILIALFITEFSMLVLWCNIEKGAFSSMKYVLSESSSNLYMDMGGDKLVGSLITLGSVFILCNVVIATGFYDQIQDQYKALMQRIGRKMSTSSVSNNCCPGVWETESETELDCERCTCEDSCTTVRRRKQNRNCF